MHTTEIKAASRLTVERLAQGSYAAKAILYTGVALFAFALALGEPGSDPNRKDVLEQLNNSWVGQGVIGLMALSLVGHTVWRLFELLYDPYEKGLGVQGWLYRLNYLLSGITYGSLALTAVKLLAGKGGGPGNQKQIWVARLLQIEGGEWLIMLVGGLIMVWGGLQIYKALSGTVYQSLEVDHLKPAWKRAIRVSSLIGFLTLGILLGCTGWYLIKGAWAENPQWVKNMDDLIKKLREFPGGSILQVVVATGLLLMGCFMAVMARYFPVKTK
jgi:hypothetical protein